MKPLTVTAEGSVNDHDAERDVIYISASGSAESSTIPAKARQARLVGNADFWYNTQATAVIPSDDVTDGSASTFLPATAERYISVPPGGTLSAISPTTTASLSISYWG